VCKKAALRHTRSHRRRADPAAGRQHQNQYGADYLGKGPGRQDSENRCIGCKNYLTKDELEALGRIINAYLDLAEERALREIPTTMEDWAKRLDAFLEFTERDILQNSGKVSAEIAKGHAESEFEKYRIVQDRLFESDFDRVVKQLGTGNEEGGET
jgi:hypothetical protein